MLHAMEWDWWCFRKFSASHLGLNCPDGDEWGWNLWQVQRFPLKHLCLSAKLHITTSHAQPWDPHTPQSSAWETKHFGLSPTLMAVLHDALLLTLQYLIHRPLQWPSQKVNCVWLESVKGSQPPINQAASQIAVPPAEIMTDDMLRFMGRSECLYRLLSIP